MILVYQLTNLNKNRVYIGVEVGKTDPILKHKTHNLIAELHDDLKSGDKFHYEEIARPKSLYYAETIQQLYIEKISPYYNTKVKDTIYHDKQKS